MLVPLFAAAVFVSAAWAAPTAEEVRAWKIGEGVQTTSGLVMGHEAAWPAGSAVSEYLGIPFAQPPVGELRWQKPVAFRGNGTINNAKFVSIN